MRTMMVHRGWMLEVDSTFVDQRSWWLWTRTFVSGSVAQQDEWSWMTEVTGGFGECQTLLRQMLGQDRGRICRWRWGLCILCEPAQGANGAHIEQGWYVPDSCISSQSWPQNSEHVEGVGEGRLEDPEEGCYCSPNVQTQMRGPVSLWRRHQGMDVVCLYSANQSRPSVRSRWRVRSSEGACQIVLPGHELQTTDEHRRDQLWHMCQIEMGFCVWMRSISTPFLCHLAEVYLSPSKALHQPDRLPKRVLLLMNLCVRLQKSGCRLHIRRSGGHANVWHRQVELYIRWIAPGLGRTPEALRSEEDAAARNYRLCWPSEFDWISRTPSRREQHRKVDSGFAGDQWASDDQWCRRPHWDQGVSVRPPHLYPVQPERHCKLLPIKADSTLCLGR